MKMMFNLDEIKELIELVDKTSVHELELENEGSRLCIRKPGKNEVVHVQPVVESALIQPAGSVSINAAGIPVITSYSIHYTKLYEGIGIRR